MARGETFTGEHRPITNADKMRLMSDAELAEFLEEIAPSDAYKFWLNGIEWKDWLKQEAECEK